MLTIALGDPNVPMSHALKDVDVVPARYPSIPGESRDMWVASRAMHCREGVLVVAEGDRLRFLDIFHDLRQVVCIGACKGSWQAVLLRRAFFQ